MSSSSRVKLPTETATTSSSSAGPSPQFPAPVGGSPYQPPANDSWPVAPPQRSSANPQPNEAASHPHAAGRAESHSNVAAGVGPEPFVLGGDIVVHAAPQQLQRQGDLEDQTAATEHQRQQHEFLYTRSLLPHVQRPALVAVLTSILDDYPQLAPLIQYRCDKAMAAVLQQQQQQHPYGVTSPSSGGWTGAEYPAAPPMQAGTPQVGGITPPSQRKLGGHRGNRGGGLGAPHDDDRHEVCGVHGTLRPLKHLIFQQNTGTYECVHGFHCLESSNPPSMCTTPQKSEAPGTSAKQQGGSEGATVHYAAHPSVVGHHHWTGHQQTASDNVPYPPNNNGAHIGNFQQSPYHPHHHHHHTYGGVASMGIPSPITIYESPELPGATGAATPPMEGQQDEVDVAKLQDLLLNVRRLSEAA